MKYLTLFITTLAAYTCYGQDRPKEAQTSDFPKVQIGINFSPDICFRTLKNNDGSATSDLAIRLNNENETAKTGYTSGLNVCFNIKKSFGLETGIQYSNKGYQTQMRNFFYFMPGGPEKGKVIYNFQYIDIPLKANFSMGHRKLRFFSSAGVTTNIFIRETSTSVVIYSDKTTRKSSPTAYPYKRVNLSPTLSVGIDYKINDRMNLRVEPTFRYGVLKIIDTPVTGYLYSSGLNIGYYVGL